MRRQSVLLGEQTSNTGATGHEHGQYLCRGLSHSYKVTRHATHANLGTAALYKLDIACIATEQWAAQCKAGGRNVSIVVVGVGRRHMRKITYAYCGKAKNCAKPASKSALVLMSRLVAWGATRRQQAVDTSQHQVNTNSRRSASHPRSPACTAQSRCTSR